MDSADAKMLDEILTWADEHDPDGARFRVEPFRQMLDRGRALTEPQRVWAKDIYERMFNVPQYENLITAGKVPRGKEVPTPAVLQNLPLKPPKPKPRSV